MSEIIEKGKAKLFHNDGDILISIPTYRNYVFIIFGLYWLYGWSDGEIYAVKTFFGGTHTTELFVWLLIWSMTGLFIVLAILWSLFGKENIYLKQSQMIVEKQLFFIKIKTTFNKSEMKNIRLGEKPYAANIKQAFKNLVSAKGMIFFEYNGKTFGIASNVEKEEAKIIHKKYF